MTRNNRLMVFAKAPIAGQVKTRLGVTIGDKAAAQLHQRLVLHTLATARQSNFSTIELWCAPGTRHPFFQQCSKRYKLKLCLQAGRDLGERMFHAFQQAPSAAVLIGTDCPALSAAYLNQAAAVLDNACDAVLGPTTDGGYSLIGLARASPIPFCGIAWGTSTVTAQTRHQFAQLNWHWEELPTLWDIDRPEDLQRAVNEFPDLNIL